MTKSTQIIHRHLHTYVKDNKLRTLYFYFFTTQIRSLRLLSSLHMALTLKLKNSSFFNLLLYASIETFISIVSCSEKNQAVCRANTKPEVYCIMVCICLLIFISSKLHSI